MKQRNNNIKVIFEVDIFISHVAKMPRLLIRNELTLLIKLVWGVSDLYTDHPVGNFV